MVFTFKYCGLRSAASRCCCNVDFDDGVGCALSVWTSLELALPLASTDRYSDMQICSLVTLCASEGAFSVLIYAVRCNVIF